VGIFDRLGDVIKSYLNDEDGRIFGNVHPQGDRPRGDPDLEAAWDELNGFLNGEDNPKKHDSNAEGRSGDGWGARPGDRNTGGWSGGGNTGGAWSGSRNTGGNFAGSRENSTGGQSSARTAARIPEELRPDFAELGLPFGASADECKTAYKRLLKLHHPDRHAGHEGNMRKATEKSARINAAYDRIEKWREREK
jgi:hypothetical protein